MRRLDSACSTPSDQLQVEREQSGRWSAQIEDIDLADPGVVGDLLAAYTLLLQYEAEDRAAAEAQLDD